MKKNAAKTKIISRLLLGFIALAACTDSPNSPAIDECPATEISAPATQGAVAAASHWLYQLQNINLPQIAASDFDILTIDYAADGYDSTRFTAAQIATLHTAGKTVLAYLSIGEAEDYRYYFSSAWRDNPPCWLGKSNPDWPGNFKVQYWAEDWQQIVLNFLDKIIAAGFDGVYLDIIDAYEYWSDNENGAGLVIEEKVAAQRMLQFVQRIAAQARLSRGKSGFLIFPQNGVAILDYDSNGEFLQTISGFGIEDLYYDGTRKQTPAEINRREPYLLQLAAAGKTVLVVDYVDDGSGYTGANKSRIDDFRNRARGNGFLPFAAFSDRELDQMSPLQQ